MSYIVITDIPLNDDVIKDVRVFYDIAEAKYYQWKQNSEYCPSRLYVLR